MKKAILGKKLGMTQKFLPDGRLVPVTVILAGPCTVVQKKTIEKDRERHPNHHRNLHPVHQTNLSR